MAWDDAEPHFEAADEDHLRRERARARELRQSMWWKNQLGRGECYYCRRRVPPRELTMDHIVPLARGGLSRKGNVVPCCRDCNRRKKYLVPVEWAAYLERLRRGGGPGPAEPGPAAPESPAGERP